MPEEFIRRLGNFRQSPGIVFHGAGISYSEILSAIDLWTEFLVGNAVPQGAVVAAEGIYSPANCALLIALMRNRNIIVPLPPGPDAKRAEFLDVAEVEYVVAASDPKQCSGLVATGRVAGHELFERLRRSGAPGLVLFSSGTTGRSKASVLDFAKLINTYDLSKLRPRRTLAFLSLDHIGGINTLMSTFSHGGCIVTVPERTPRAVFEAVAAFRVDTLPTTPTFLTMSLMSGDLAKHDLSSLRLITYGTEPMPVQTLRKLNAILPEVRLKQTYGLSEVGILPTKSRSNDSLWVKFGTAGFQHKIVDGILWVRSDMAMLGYLNAKAPFDEEGYFDTQDVVEVDGEYVHILGRKSEIINVGGEKVYPNEVESVLLEIENVVEATVSGQPSPVTGNVVKALVRLAVSEPQPLVYARIREYCRGRLEPFKVPVVVDITDRPQHSGRLKKIRVAS
ncbi:MAG: fatty acid--CoA ligase family protein [Magnetospirillum sp.]|nr:fatty acid--CoA ligase family protein [Magnetospirillum sp.]